MPDWLLLALVFSPFLFILALALFSHIEKRKRLRDPATVVKVIDGKRYIATVKTRPLVRNVKSGHRAALLGKGWEHYPAGTVRKERTPRWIHVLPLSRNGGIKKPKWVNALDWEVVGETQYEELDRV